MKIYHYNKLGEYTGVTEARLDPLEKKNGIERWLLPAMATFKKPPECKDGEIPVMSNGTWAISKITIEEEKTEEVVSFPQPDPKEVMIMEKMRELAIEALKKEGKL